MTTLDRVSQLLTQGGIDHALIGAAALAARGVARSTFDVDLLVADPGVLDPRTWQPLEASGLAVEIRRGDDDDPLGGVVRIEAPRDRPVDVVLGKRAWQTRAITRAQKIPGGPPVVLARDLILLKLYAGGSQDHWDIAELLRHSDRPLLVTEVDAEISELDQQTRDAWRRLKHAAGTH